MKAVNWGVLSTALIGVDKVIPAMQQSPLCNIGAIASRDLAKAQQSAQQLGIAKAYGSYEELLDDPDIEAIYNPLPNNLHLEWSSKALSAGKHVLCEKPIAMSAAEAQQLLTVRDETGLYIEEAFMVRNHPQWLTARQLVNEGRIGELRTMQIAFTYNNKAADNIRNKVETGGGAIYDLGCYACTVSRFIFADEPTRVIALIDRDPEFGTDRLSSAILDFPTGQVTFYVSTQTARYQGIVILGDEGWLRFEIPFVPLPPFDCAIHIGGNEFPGPHAKEAIPIEQVNQYTLQGERFSRLIRGEDIEQWPLENAVANMRIIDALFRSAESQRWETVV